MLQFKNTTLPCALRTLSASERYLDNMLQKPLNKAEASLMDILELCRQMGLPLSRGKIIHPTSTLEFLGLTIEACAQTIDIPLEKVKKATKEINYLLRHWTTKTKVMLSTASQTNFVHKSNSSKAILLKMPLRKHKMQTQASLGSSDGKCQGIPTHILTFSTCLQWGHPIHPNIGNNL